MASIICYKKVRRKVNILIFKTAVYFRQYASLNKKAVI